MCIRTWSAPQQLARGQPIEKSPRISIVRWQKYSPPCWAMNPVQIVRDWDDKSVVTDKSRVVNKKLLCSCAQFFFGIVRLVTFCLERCQGGILYYLVNYPQIRSSSSTPPPSPPLPHSSLIFRLTSSFDRSRSFHPFSTLHQFLSNFGLPYQLYQANNRGPWARTCWTSEHPPQLDYQTPLAKTIILKSLKPTYPIPVSAS